MTKEELELEKVKLEIEELRKPWYFKASYLGIIIPSAVAFFSILSIYLTGIFDVKRELLKLDKENLAREIEKFELNKKVIITQIDSLDSILQLRDENIHHLKKENISLHVELGLLKSQLTNISSPYYQKITPSTFNATIKDESIRIRLLLTQKMPIGVYKVPDNFFELIFNNIGNFIKENNYKKENIKIIITASADNIVIMPNRISYNGEFGEIKENYYLNDTTTLKKISFERNTNVNTNEQLSFLRAYGIKKELIKSDLFNSENIITRVKVNSQLGADYREVELELIIKTQN